MCRTMTDWMNTKHPKVQSTSHNVDSTGCDERRTQRAGGAVRVDVIDGAVPFVIQL